MFYTYITKDIVLLKSAVALCGRLDGRGVQGRMGTCICMAEALCWPPETIRLFLGCTPIQNKKLKKKCCCKAASKRHSLTATRNEENSQGKSQLH